MYRHPGRVRLPLLKFTGSAVTAGRGAAGRRPEPSGEIERYFVAVGLLGVDDGSFWSQMQSKVDLHEDVYNGVIKSLVFGVVVSWIAVFEGYDAVPTSEGVSRATTRTVVYAAFAVLGLDFVLTALMFGDY